MTYDKREFRVGNYVRAFEKSLNYMCAAFLAIAIVFFCCDAPDSADLLKEINELLSDILKGDPKETLLKIFTIIVGVLSALPYYFYYTLRDNHEWNLYGGRKDLDGLLKVYVLYEIATMGLFYLLLPRKEDYAGLKLIVASMGFLLVVSYVVILLYQHKRGRILVISLS